MVKVNSRTKVDKARLLILLLPKKKSPPNPRKKGKDSEQVKTNKPKSFNTPFDFILPLVTWLQPNLGSGTLTQTNGRFK